MRYVQNGFDFWRRIPGAASLFVPCPWNPLSRGQRLRPASPAAAGATACPFSRQQKTPGRVQPFRLPLSGVHDLYILLGGLVPPALQAASSCQTAPMPSMKRQRGRAAIHIYRETQHALQNVCIAFSYCFGILWKAIAPSFPCQIRRGPMPSPCPFLLQHGCGSLIYLFLFRSLFPSSFSRQSLLQRRCLQAPGFLP